MVFWAGVAFLGFLQVTAVLLNLLPIPGLDGYGALEPHLSPRRSARWQPAKQWAFFILLLLLFAPALNHWFFGRSCTGSSTCPACLRWLVGVGSAAHPVLVGLVLSNALRHMRHYA